MSAPASSEAATAALAARAVEAVAGNAGLLLISEHAGNRVPAPWRSLGLAPALLDTHFAWDAGAGAMTRLLAQRLAAPAICGVYSRLFLDLNRFPGDWDCLRPDLGGIPVPANLAPDDDERALRERIAREPFDRAVAEVLGGRRAVISIHSFTPLFEGRHRRTEIGVLWRKEGKLGPAFLDRLRQDGQFVVGDNEPYDWREAEGYSLRRHGLDRDLPCLYLELRNDLLASEAGRERMAQALLPALAAVA
jgi:predicted N-formylglutamate amidohydrolase